MKILITNDDGISAPGLSELHEIAVALAGSEDKVWTIAPAMEQSGVGHCVSYTTPMMLMKMSPRRYAIEGTPADCVLAGIHELLSDAPPDLILSGVNRGNNSADNALYSGTLGAAMEGALQNIPAIALSQYYGPGNRDLADTFEAARQHGLTVIKRILSAAPRNTSEYALFYNVNFPPVAAEAVKGIKVTPQGSRPDGHFRTIPQNSPSGRRYLWLSSGAQQTPSAPGSDAHVNLQGYISVTPMRPDLTAHDVLDQLRGIE